VPSQHLDTREKIVKYWQGQSTFVTGLTQEPCRDLTHSGYGISAISHVAETSRIQGQDLYGTDVGERLRQALGFQAKYQLGTAVPDWLCGGSLKVGLGPVTEVGGRRSPTGTTSADDPAVAGGGRGSVRVVSRTVRPPSQAPFVAIIGRKVDAA
jgi:hypothetical protein